MSTNNLYVKTATAATRAETNAWKLQGEEKGVSIYMDLLMSYGPVHAVNKAVNKIT